MDISSIKQTIKTKFSLTTLLIMVNVVVFLVTYLLAANIGIRDSLLLLGAEYVPFILNGQFWRLILPSFLHANPLHLILNMWALYHLGNAIETFYGRKKLVLVYILSGLAGVLLSATATLVNAYLNQGDIVYPISVGSSAAVFGFVGLLLGNRFKKSAYSVSIDNYINTSQLWLFVGYNVIIGFGINFFGGSSFAINNFAHIGGFIAGLAFGATLDLINTTYQSKFHQTFEKLVYYLAISLLVLSIIGEIIYIILIA